MNIFRIAFIILFVISWSAAISPTADCAEHDAKYIIKATVNLRAKPDTTSAVLATMPRNTSLAVLEQRNGWLCILAPGNGTGWVRGDLTSDTVIRIHTKEQTLTAMAENETLLAVPIMKGTGNLPENRRYFLNPYKDKLTLSWPNRKDLRQDLSAGRRTYPSYRTALLDKENTESSIEMAICPAENTMASCAARLERRDFDKLKSLIPLGARLEIYKNAAEDDRINRQDALSRDILQGALDQLKYPAVGLRPDARLPELVYPGGDIQPDFASSADIVIRAVRSAGADLQCLTHEDIVLHPDHYNGVDLGPDQAAAHRRIPVLRAYLRHHALTLPANPEDAPYSFAGGDIVFISTDTTDTMTPDIVGIVSEEYNPQGLPRIITIGGRGQHTTKKDMLSRRDLKVTDHFRMTHLFDYQ